MEEHIPRDIKIVITGGTGFLGSYVLQACIDAGFTNIVALYRNRNKISNLDSKVTWISSDILDIIHLNEIITEGSMVIHVAGLVAYDPKQKERIFQVNEEGTANVVNTALANKARKVVHISSIAALGKKKSGATIDETALWVNSPSNTVYATSKYLAEQQVWRAQEEGLDVTILNPSVILGIGPWGESSLQMLPLLQKNSKFYPTGKTGYVDVKDVAHIAVKALSSQFNGQRYIISEDNYFYKTIFTWIAQSMNIAVPSVSIKPYIWKILVWSEKIKSFFTNKSPLITPQTANMFTFEANYDNSKSIKAFNHTYIPIEETIHTMTEAYKLDLSSRKK